MVRSPPSAMPTTRSTPGRSRVARSQAAAPITTAVIAKWFAGLVKDESWPMIAAMLRSDPAQRAECTFG